MAPIIMRHPRTPTATPTAAPVDNPLDPDSASGGSLVLAPDDTGGGYTVTVATLTLPSFVTVETSMLGDGFGNGSSVLGSDVGSGEGSDVGSDVGRGCIS